MSLGVDIPSSFGDPDDGGGLDLATAKPPAAPQPTRVLDPEALAGLDSDEEAAPMAGTTSTAATLTVSGCVLNVTPAAANADHTPRAGGLETPNTRKSALSSGMKSPMPGMRKTVTLNGLAEELSHRLEDPSKPAQHVTAVPLNDAAETTTGGLDPQFAAMLQHKLSAEGETADADGGGVVDPAQLQAALGGAGGSAERRGGYYDDDDGGGGGAVLQQKPPPPTRSNTVVLGNPITATSSASNAWPEDPTTPMPTRAGTVAADDEELAQAALRAQLLDLGVGGGSGQAPPAALTGAPDAEEPCPSGLRAPHATTKLDAGLLDSLDDDCGEDPGAPASSSTAAPAPGGGGAAAAACSSGVAAGGGGAGGGGGGGFDIDFAAKLQLSLEREQGEAAADYEPGQAQDDEEDLAPAPQGARAPKPTLKLDAGMIQELADGIPDLEEPKAALPPQGSGAAAASSSSCSRPQASAPQPAAAADSFQAQLAAKLQGQLGGCQDGEAPPQDALATSLMSGELETSLKRKLAAEEEEEADEALTEAQGVRAPKCTVVLTEAAMGGLWESEEEKPGDHGASHFKEDLQSALSSHWGPSAAGAAPAAAAPVIAPAGEAASAPPPPPPLPPAAAAAAGEAAAAAAPEPRSAAPAPAAPAATAAETELVRAAAAAALAKAAAAPRSPQAPAAPAPAAQPAAQPAPSASAGAGTAAGRLAGLSKEQLTAENEALRQEVEALRGAVQRRRQELGIAVN